MSLTTAETIYHNITMVSNLKMGDLIQFKRVGFSHWAVYIGDWKVVHMAGAKVSLRPVFTYFGQRFDNSQVCVEDLRNFVESCKFYINNSKDKKFKPLRPDQIVNNALSVVGDIEYNLFTFNCEHFVNWCRYGVTISDQVDNILFVAFGIA